MPKKKAESKKGGISNIVVDMLNLAELKQPCEVLLIPYTKLINNAKNRYSTVGIEALADSIKPPGCCRRWCL